MKSPQKAPRFEIRCWFEYFLGTRTYKFFNDFNAPWLVKLRFFESVYAISNIKKFYVLFSISLLYAENSILPFYVISDISLEELYYASNCQIAQTAGNTH